MGRRLTLTRMRQLFPELNDEQLERLMWQLRGMARQTVQAFVATPAPAAPDVNEGESR